ncbi:DUF1707 and DUF4190 domain-containing protein [Streptomyces sp. CA2R106]|uniref:DUF1707 and DUF4190 domain-containing protein n=1 Tax=Streptomyces sp. CA2R106 TaxID=3120153 RepID=UPI00300A8285
MLASDGDRERAVDILKEAYTQGRLRPEEYDERVGRAYQARTYDDLDRITADIPHPAAPPYPLPPPAPAPVFVPEVRRTNTAATASLVCGVLAAFTLGATAIPAVICGHVAKTQIRRTGESGDGQATAGLILGYACLAVITAFIALVVAFIATAPGP